MAEITKDQMERLHRSGAALSQSWLLYARPDLKTQWQELHQQSALEALSKGIEAAAEMEGDTATKAAHALAGPQAILSARGALERTLKANIQSYISDGHLHGFGYELPRSLSSVPVAIPKAAWAGKSDWNNGTLSFRGLEFADVRLTTNRLRNEILERGNVDKTPAKPSGRPSLGPAITKAFKALNEAGKINPTRSQKSHFPLVREWLSTNDTGLSSDPSQITDEGIRAHFSILFNALRETRKQ